MDSPPPIPCPFDPAALLRPLTLSYLTSAEVGAAVLLSAAAWHAEIPGTLPSDDGILAAIARMPLDAWAASAARLRDALGIVPLRGGAEGVCELSLVRRLHDRALDEADSRRARTLAATQAAAAKRQRSGERGEPPSPHDGPPRTPRGRSMPGPTGDRHGVRHGLRDGERDGLRDGERDVVRRVAAWSASDPYDPGSARRSGAPIPGHHSRSAPGSARSEVVGVVGAGALGAIEELFAREWPRKCEAWVALMLKRATFPWIQDARRRTLPPHVIDAAVRAHGQDPERVAYVLRRIADEKTPDAIGWLIKGLGLNDVGRRQPWDVALWFNRGFSAVMDRTRQEVLAECRARVTLMRPPRPPEREVRDGR